MQQLRLLADSIEHEERATDFGKINIESLKINFTPAEPRYLSDKSLSRTYTSKPLVKVDDEVLFGELAILKYLQKDGWDGVWIDTFHGRGKKKVFWSGMHPNGRGKLTKGAEKIYNKIIKANNRKSSGFFDVFAWKNGKYIFIEYKGEGDAPNKNETRWINAALKSGIKPEQLFFVTC